jgi:hypothetical protein
MVDYTGLCGISSPNLGLSSSPHHGAADRFLVMRLCQTLRKTGVTALGVLAG